MGTSRKIESFAVRQLKELEMLASFGDRLYTSNDGGSRKLLVAVGLGRWLICWVDVFGDLAHGTEHTFINGG